MPIGANDSTYKQTFLGEPLYENWNLTDCGIENILSEWELQFQVVNLATIGISLYEDLQEALRHKKHCLKINPEHGFESNIITEKRLIQILKILTMCSLNQAMLRCRTRSILSFGV